MIRSCLTLCGIGFLGLMFLGFIAAMVGEPVPNRPATPTTTSEPSVQSQAVQSVAEELEPIDEPEIPAGPSLTAASFAQCRPGMTFDEVVAIVGEPDQLMSENELSGFHTAMYMWKGGFVANANMTFQDGKLVSKAQFGL